jgi:diguanylate cyclase (GGDEF)-like protein/PAS domain S-box-containing protein
VPEPDELLRQLLDQLFDGVYFVNGERRITHWNAGAERITGYTAAEVVGQHCHDGLLCHVDEDGNSLCDTLCGLQQALVDGSPTERLAFLKHSHGHRIPVLVRTAVLRDAEGGVTGALEVFSDDSRATDLLERAREAERLAQVDPLTGLANRRAIDRRWDELSAGVTADHTFGVILLDIDYFKRFNDQHGHAMGDSVLRTVAQTLVENLRRVDLAGRWGGEEFIVLLPDATETLLVRVAERLRTMIARSTVTGTDGPLAVTASFGLTLVAQGDTRESVMARVDGLLYQSKHAGRHRISHAFLRVGVASDAR